MTKVRLTTLFFLVLLLMLASACGGSEAAPGVMPDVGPSDASVEAGFDGLDQVVLQLEASPASISLRPGQSVQVVIRARTETGKFDVEPRFEVDDPSVASVAMDGTVTGLSQGTTFVSASWVQREIFVSVTVRSEFVAALEIIPRSSEIGPGELLTLRIGTSPPEAEVELDWTVADSAVVRFDQDLLVLEGLEPGETVIRAAGAGLEAETRIVVRGDPSELVAGDAHTCARIAGSLFCWGDDSQGQLGHSESGVGRVEGRFKAVAAGGRHTCGITEDGTFCWGDDSQGQLGAEAVMGVAELDTEAAFVDISAGRAHTCALDAAGAAYCWGSNEDGQLGPGDLQPREAPTRVNSGARFSTIAAGARHTCAIDIEDDRLWCWGSNRVGQLATTDRVSAESPRRVASMNRYLAVTAGGLHTCAISSTQTPQCWGSNQFGQLGDGTITDRTAPIFVSSTVGYTRLSAGERTTCGASTSGQIECWGDSREGQGAGFEPRQNELPVIIPAPSAASASRVAVGEAHVCAVWGERVWCWGDGEKGQLVSTSSRSSTPIPIPLF